jgi:hypothetical protein
MPFLRYHRFWHIIILITLLLYPGAIASAASGLPDSTDFGYGARLDIWGEAVELAIKTASGIGIDWIGIDFYWSRHWPTDASSIDLEKLDQAMHLARDQNLDVMLSIKAPPAWAMTPYGPDVKTTAGLVALLANRYPENLLAIELFPAANTVQGWGAPPNPTVYTSLLEATHSALKSSGSMVAIVAAGLNPISPEHAQSDMSDLEFLNKLYEAGATPYMPIVSIRFTQIVGDIMSPSDSNETRILRRYEAIRQIMLTNNHGYGLIWITGFTWPGTYNDISLQIDWLEDAYQLIKSQLYIGAAFFDRLNPPLEVNRSTSSHDSLILIDEENTRLHPAIGSLGQIINFDHSNEIEKSSIRLYKKITSGSVKKQLKLIKP